MGVISDYRKQKQSGNVTSKSYVSIKDKSDASKLGDDISSFYDTNSAFLASVDEDSKNTSYRANSSEWYKNYANRINELKTTADALKSRVDKYSSLFDEDSVKSFNDYYNGILNDYDNILSYSKSTSDYWSQWKDENEYNSALKKSKELDALKSTDTVALKSQLDDYKMRLAAKSVERNKKIKEVSEEFPNGPTKENAQAYGDAMSGVYDSEYDELSKKVSELQKQYDSANEVQNGSAHRCGTQSRRLRHLHSNRCYNAKPGMG